MSFVLRELLPALVALALPPRCPGCGRVVADDHLFCAGCWAGLDFLGSPACDGCGLPFDYDPGAGVRCGACLRDPPAIDGMRAAIAYGPVARALVLRLKYGMRPGLAKTFARMMRRRVSDLPDALLVPVPLHPRRIWRRGYNQSALIATALGRELGLSVALDLLARRRATPVLRGLGPRDRAKAVRGAFAVSDARRDALAGRTVLLVDDVYTTGATVNACARALRRAGAARVIACCWARVVRDIDNGLAG